MIDILKLDANPTMIDGQSCKARNIIVTQLGSIYYDNTIGIDIDLFLNSDFKITNESFFSYIVGKLSENGVEISSADFDINNFIGEFNFDLATPTDTSLIN